MRTLLYILLLCLGISDFLSAQSINSTNPIPKKGKMYIYWGWNRSGYSKSNIHFKGDYYNFTLNKVIAKDRPTDFSFDIYFNPSTITIPQYNLRIGYYINDSWDISIGADHMKYVVRQNQTVNINGNITNSQTPYDGNYTNNQFIITPDFLQFEHTDGLNYENIELRHNNTLLYKPKVNLSIKEGLGIGILYPKTNTTLLNNPRYDEFHLAGFGLAAVLSLNATFFNTFFIQTEFKGGFIDMPDIRTTMNKSDKARQSFFFYQYNGVFGFDINLGKKSKRQNLKETDI